MAGAGGTDMTRGSIARPLFRFTLPLMFGNLFQLSYNMVDTIVIGRFAGSASLAAVGTCDQIMTLLILGISGICVGASVLMGNFYGAGDRQRLKEELETTLGIGMIFSALTLCAGIPLTRAMLTAMQMQPEAMPDATAYLRIIFAGMPFTCLYNTYAAALRSIGDAKTPVRYLVYSCLMNMALDWLLVAGLGAGVAGAGWATVAAQAASALLCIRHVNRKTPALTLERGLPRINRELARKTLSYGTLTALQQCAQPIGNIIIQGSVNGLGVTAAAAFSAVRKIEDIGLLPGRSIGSAMTAFIAQNEGAGNRERSESGFRTGMGMEAAAGVLVCLLVLLLRKPLMHLFTADAQIVAEGICYFALIGFCYWLPCLTNGIQGYFRGMGRMACSLAATLTQISFRTAATLLLVGHTRISGVGTACVIGWSAMLGWTVPYRARVGRTGREKRACP